MKDFIFIRNQNERLRLAKLFARTNPLTLFHFLSFPLFLSLSLKYLPTMEFAIPRYSKAKQITVYSLRLCYSELQIAARSLLFPLIHSSNILISWISKVVGFLFCLSCAKIKLNSFETLTYTLTDTFEEFFFCARG